MSLIINEDEIHVIQVDLKKDMSDEWTYLSVDEQERANRYHFSKDKNRFIIARGALRLLLGHYLQIKPNEIIFDYNEYQKPSLSTQKKNPIIFNLSHSHDIALIAVQLGGEIGVDIECIKRPYLSAVVNRYFSEEEIRYINQCSSDLQASCFYRIWSRKEAAVKAIGRGLTIPFASFSVPNTSNQTAFMFQGNLYYLHPLFIHKNFESALVTSLKINKIKYFSMSYSQGQFELQEKLIDMY